MLQTRTIRHPGRAVCLRETGTGPVVLALHAAGADGRTWAALARRLPHRHVLAPDLLGHGQSEHHAPGDRGYEAQAALVVQLLDALDAPVELVGHSVGAFAGLLATLARPERVRRLILYEPVAFGVLHHTGQFDLAEPLARVYPRWDAADPEPWLRGFFDYWGADGAWDRLPPAARARLVASGDGLHEEAHSVTFDTRYTDQYAALRVPVTLLAGTHSPAASRAIAAGLAASIPNAVLEQVEAGHLGPLTRPGAVAERIRDHLHHA